MKDLKELELNEISDYLLSINEKPFRAKQIYKWLWNKNVSSIDQMTDISIETREKIKENFILNPIKIIHSAESKKDGSIKYAFSTFDNLIIEGVIIPDKDRATACISTQVGCPLKCSFCATGKMGFSRNLSTSEIYEQVFLLNEKSTEKFGHKLSNIVMMGMGEPLLNLKNTLKAVDFVTNNYGLAMSPDRITISTVGIVKQLIELSDFKPKFNLAISLHSAINSKRSKIMPVNLSNPLPELINALKYYYKKTEKRISFEYLMLGGFNDSLDDAKALAEFCKNFPSKINLIEYNATPSSQFKKSTQKEVYTFTEFLKSKNLIVTIRRSKGTDIDAACGQLASKMKLKK